LVIRHNPNGVASGTSRLMRVNLKKRGATPLGLAPKRPVPKVAEYGNLGL